MALLPLVCMFFWRTRIRHAHRPCRAQAYDVWSLGLSVLMVITKRNPFHVDADDPARLRPPLFANSEAVKDCGWDP